MASPDRRSGPTLPGRATAGSSAAPRPRRRPGVSPPRPTHAASAPPAPGAVTAPGPPGVPLLVQPVGVSEVVEAVVRGLAQRVEKALLHGAPSPSWVRPPNDRAGERRVRASDPSAGEDTAVDHQILPGAVTRVVQ